MEKLQYKQNHVNTVYLHYYNIVNIVMFLSSYT